MRAQDLSLTIVIPVFNEAQRLMKTFDELTRFLTQPIFKKVSVIFVDDGSRDKTAAILKNAQLNCPVEIISYSQNQGKGFAVRQGMLKAEGDYALLADADMSTSLLEIKKFIPLIEQGQSVIIGTRKSAGANLIRPQPWQRRFLGGVYTWLANIATGASISDFTCGFKCFSKEARAQIFPVAKINRWSYDAELLFLAKKFGFAIREIPIDWENDIDTRVRLGKDIIQSFIDLVRIRL